MSSLRVTTIVLEDVTVRANDAIISEQKHLYENAHINTTIMLRMHQYKHRIMPLLEWHMYIQGRYM